jgi:uncharacterized protein YbjT (DUF2867 family)
VPATGSRSRSVLLCGATGLVGRHCLQLLAGDPRVGRVVALVRRPVGEAMPAGTGRHRVEERIADFGRLDAAGDAFRVDAVVCALGTTIRTAGSPERFREVDFGYPMAIAKLALEEGARHFLLVSSAGASVRSRFFYTRVKGELDAAVSALPYAAVTIVRPSLLLGERDEFRPGEALGRRLGFLAPRRYRPVHAADVAAALVQCVVEPVSGRRIVESHRIPELAARFSA